MDLELKEFEDKINNITEQFISLLDSNKGSNGSVGNRYNITTDSENQSNGPTIFNAGSIENGIYGVCNSNNYNGESTFKLETDNIRVGGIAYENCNSIGNDVPKHAIKFDSVEQMDLNKKLESLYFEKNPQNVVTFNGGTTITYADSNLTGINGFNGNETYKGYTKEETDSTLNNKEVNEMSGYNGEEKKENVFYSFATVPAEKALVEKKDWKEVLFMDIPWDTKIDIWGGIKKLCTAQVRITFD